MKKEKWNVFFRSLLLQGYWNYAQLQNIGLLLCTLPALKRLYSGNQNSYKRALARNMETFNSHPVMSAYSIGAVIKQEEKLAQTNPSSAGEEEREWRIIKVSTANTAASIGDRLFWATLRPLSLVLCFVILSWGEMSVLNENSSRGEVSFIITLALMSSLAVYNVPALAARFKGLGDSYNGMEENFYGLINLNWNKAIYFLKTLGQGLTAFIIFHGLYINFSGAAMNADFITKISLIIAFVTLSVFMKKFNIPNIYLYIIATVVFGFASFLA